MIRVEWETAPLFFTSEFELLLEKGYNNFCDSIIKNIC